MTRRRLGGLALAATLALVLGALAFVRYYSGRQRTYLFIGCGFVAAGGADVPEGKANYRDHIVRRGETSPEALREKARFVLAEMEARMQALGAGWADATGTQVYTVHDLHPFFADEIVARGAAPAGLTWHYARPPVEGLEYEMDVRGVPVERTI